MSYLKHKPGSIEELMANEASKLNDNAYQDMFKKELDKAGKGIGGMSPKEKKDFFNKIDTKYKAKNEELSAAQKKLPPALQKAIAKKMSDKTEEDAYDKDDEKPAKPKKEDLDAKELQTKKTDNYKSKNESWKQAWEAATHKMPDGTIMKGAKHKDEALDSKDNKTVKDVVGQLKKAVKAHDGQAKDLEKAMKNEADDVDNGDEKKDTKKKLHADSGSKLTKVETEPSVDYKN